MARARARGDGRLEDAIATLIQNQTAFVARLAKTDARMAEMDRINAERFARIEALLLEHNRIIAEHTRILEGLTEAAREKIGFRPPRSRNRSSNLARAHPIAIAARMRPMPVPRRFDNRPQFREARLPPQLALNLLG